MPRHKVTEADLRRRLAESGYSFDDDTVPDRIRILLEMASATWLQLVCFSTIPAPVSATRRFSTLRKWA